MQSGNRESPWATPLESGLGRSSKGVAVIKGVPANAQRPAGGHHRGGSSKRGSVAAHLGGRSISRGIY